MPAVQQWLKKGSVNETETDSTVAVSGSGGMEWRDRVPITPLSQEPTHRNKKQIDIKKEGCISNEHHWQTVS